MSAIPTDTALTITFGHSINDETHQKVVSLYRSLRLQNIYGIKDIIPAYATLTVVYDVVRLNNQSKLSPYKYILEVIESILQKAPSPLLETSRTMHIPVCYEVSFGIDLINISQQKQMAVEEIIRLHTSVAYRVYMLGFLPGFAYMGKVDEKIAMPRKAVPHQNVPAGSVGIADTQTGIYPFNSPGGWNIIGETPESLFRPHLSDPCLFQPGDHVQFVPVTLDKFYELKEAK